MRRETWLADEVEVTVSGAFTTHHLLRTGAGILGESTVPALRKRAVIRTAEGRELVMKQTNWWRGTYELQEGDTLLGTVRPLGIFRRENIVRFGHQDYRLRAVGLWGRLWHLADDAGRTLVEVHRRGIFRRGAILRILSPLDLDLLVFTYHIVNARWDEQTTAAAAGGS